MNKKEGKIYLFLYLLPHLKFSLCTMNGSTVNIVLCILCVYWFCVYTGVYITSDSAQGQFMVLQRSRVTPQSAQMMDPETNWGPLYARPAHIFLGRRANPLKTINVGTRRTVKDSWHLPHTWLTVVWSLVLLMIFGALPGENKDRSNTKHYGHAPRKNAS